MGKEGFGVADNLSTPPNSLPVSPAEGMMQTEDDDEEENNEQQSPSPHDHEHQSNESSSFNNNRHHNQPQIRRDSSHSPSAQTRKSSSSTTNSSVTIESTPLITASKVIELIGSSSSKSFEGGGRKGSVSDIPAPIDPDTPLLRVLSEIERGNSHSLTSSTDLEEEEEGREGRLLGHELLKLEDEEERSVNEDLSLHDGLRDEVRVSSSLLFASSQFLNCVFLSVTSLSFCLSFLSDLLSFILSSRLYDLMLSSLPSSERCNR